MKIAKISCAFLLLGFIAGLIYSNIPQRADAQIQYFMALNKIDEIKRELSIRLDALEERIVRLENK